MFYVKCALNVEQLISFKHIYPRSMVSTYLALYAHPMKVQKIIVILSNNFQGANIFQAYRKFNNIQMTIIIFHKYRQT